jgi:hypothetical protein
LQNIEVYTFKKSFDDPLKIILFTIILRHL